jgi:predicted nucleic acid-binding protein
VKLIVSDASPLIVLARSELIPVLNAMIDEVIIPRTVYGECTIDLKLPGAAAIHLAVEARQIQVRPDEDHGDEAGEVLVGLDAGEIAAIHLALALQCPVLMDERLGRQAARRKGLTVIGSAGLLLGAKQRGLIPNVAPIIGQWRGMGYFLSAEVVRAVLERAGEA